MGDHLPFFVMFTQSEVLKTPQLTLRPFEKRDVERLIALINQWDVASMTAGMPFPYTRSHAIAFLDRVSLPHARALAFDNFIVGGCSFMPRATGDFEIGYWVGKPYWRRGFASECAAALVERAFADFRTRRITAGFFVDNPVSGRVQHRLGFNPIGRSEVFCTARGCFVQTQATELTRAQWQARTSP